MFHCSHAWLEPGSVIKNGNYGRVLNFAKARHNHWLREQFLEFIRASEFPDKPSRFNAAFCCEDLEAARYFKHRNCETGILYRVEFVDPSAPCHVTDFNLIQPLAGIMEDMKDVARHYWSASFWTTVNDKPSLTCAETLIESPLRVIEEIE